MESFKKYNKVLVNGKSRVVYVKARSRSDNPVLYIKNKGEMITYKKFLKIKKSKRGGVKLKRI
jgi:hypothetical protein